jgi:HAD superfamily hydrolase (TIGR01509 family)
LPLDAVIFDIDGTFVDSNPLHARAWAKAFEQHDLGLPVRRFEAEIGKGSPAMLRDLLGPEEARKRESSLSEAHGTHYHAILDDEGVRVFPKAVAMLEAVQEKGLPTAIATAADRRDLEHVLDVAGLDLLRRVDAVVAGSDVARSKPAPDVVEAAAQKLGVSPAQCAMIGDTPYDAMASLRAGAVCLGVRTGVHTAADMHRAGARASYAHPADLLMHLDEALSRAAPASISLTPERMQALMDEALSEARAGLERKEIPIGSVLVDGAGQVIGRGRNTARASGATTAHAEMNAFADAAGRDLRAERGTLLVTTLEPCVMCLGAALEAQVDTIIYALAAPENGGMGRCRPLDRPDSFMPRRVGGVGANKSRALLTAWQEQHGTSGFVKRLLAS